MIFTAIGQYIGAKVVTTILVVSGAGAVIWFWRHPEQLETIWETLKYALVWIGIVLVLPWAMFFVTAWAISKDSNKAAGLILLGYVVLDAIVAFALIGRWSGLGALTWLILLLGFLCAGVYNYKVCEYQASRLEES